ncbi:MAG: hypothetical protein GF383_03515 [Candidatus Lokiarchaeota archaeon]|nr:hypothetical protein [Candidatus Lokiarchaeota archaeon]MBD3338714.1 hypothetical protein [Candidatus Lokiarchaeota archaeon]
MNEIIINVNSEKTTINQNIYGSFIEHIGECIHNGIWTYDPVSVPLVSDQYPRIKKVRMDVLDALKNMNLPLLRAFGGCYADLYHWKDAIGPLNERKTVKNLHWGEKEFEEMEGVGPVIENQFGTDEFLALCEIINAEPYLNVNYGSGTPGEAADWVEYCNGTTNTPFGTLRAKNGREKPYNVKIWGIANEIYGFWEVGYEKDPENYAEKYLKFAKKMREKDPTLKLIACGYQNSSWNRSVLEHIGQDWVDYLSFHLYLPYIAGGREKPTHPDNEKCYHALMASSRLVEGQLNNAWKDITTVFGNQTHVRLAFDEWGLWYLNRDIIKTNFNLQDGIYTALILKLLQRTSGICPIANWAQLINCIGMIQTDPDGLILTPVYLAFKMISEHSFNNLIDAVLVQSPTFDSSKFGAIPKYKDVPYLESSSTIDDKGENLSILLLNKHISDSLTVNVEIKEFLPENKAKIFELTGDSPFEYNTTEYRDKITISERVIDNIEPNITINLEPHSLAILKLTKTE